MPLKSLQLLQVNSSACDLADCFANGVSHPDLDYCVASIKFIYKMQAKQGLRDMRELSQFDDIPDAVEHTSR